MSQEKTDSRQQTVRMFSTVYCLLGSKGSTLLGKITQAKACGYYILEKGGFSLLEIVIVLAITGILAGGLATVGHQVIKKEREDKTTEHMKRLKVAVMGDPLDVRHGIRTSFGYFGDMGVLPSTLDNLYILGAQTPYNPATLPTYNMAAGWNGPYINPQTMEYLSNLNRDYFGQDLQYTSPATNPDPITGVNVEKRIVSSGRDREVQVGTVNEPGDDLYTVFFNNELYSQVSGFVRDAEGNSVPGVTMTLNYPSSGSRTTTTVTTDTSGLDTGLYTFPSIPYGNHSLSISNPKLFLAPGTGQTSGGFGNDVSFVIVNTGSSVSLTSINVSYNMNPTTYYEKVYVGTNATAVYTYTTNRIVSGTLLTFAGQTINGATDLAEPVAVCVQSPVTAVPDIPLTHLGRGSATEVKLTGFTDLQTPPPSNVPDTNKINMIGVVFTITLTLSTGSSSTVYFIP